MIADREKRVVEVGAHAMTYFVKGHDGDVVIASYIEAGDYVETSFHRGLDRISELMRSISGAVAIELLESDVYKPMSSEVYIDSPKFDYDNFASRGHEPSGGFDAWMKQEREKMVAEQKAEESEIDRRLGGAS